MVNQVNIKCDYAVAIGDLHGYFNSLISAIKRYEIENTCIIVCGDCGLGFYKPGYYSTVFKNLESMCRKRSITVVFVRGNHDDPSYFETGKANTAHILAVPDYTVINGTALCVGGATSIDRKTRINQMASDKRHYIQFHPFATEDDISENYRKCYWPNEQPFFDIDKMDDIKSNGIQITTVITHTCPSFCYPTTKDGLENWLKEDDQLEADMTYERGEMDRLYRKLADDGHPVSQWVYGHFHEHRRFKHEGVDFCLLDGVEYEGGNIDWIELKNIINV